MAFFDKENHMVSGIPCAVVNCKATRRSHPYRKFYGFPKENSPFFQIWVDKCSLSHDSLKKKLIICEKHFDETDKGKRKLKKNAIPKLYLGDPDMVLMDESVVVDSMPMASNSSSDLNLPENLSKYKNIKTYGYKDSGTLPEMSIFDFENIKSPRHYSNTSCSVEADCTNCIKYIKITELYKKKYLSFKKHYDILKTKYIKNRKTLIYLQFQNKRKLIPNKKLQSQHTRKQIDESNLSLAAKYFAKMILCRNSKTSKYLQEQRNIAQNVYFISPACYRFLRDNLKLNLPSKSSIINWMPIKNLAPGLNENVVENLKKKLRIYQLKIVTQF